MSQKRILLIGQAYENLPNVFSENAEDVRDITNYFSTNGVAVSVVPWEDIPLDSSQPIMAYDSETKLFRPTPLEGIDLVVLRQLGSGSINENLGTLKRLFYYLQTLDVPTVNGPQTMLENVSKKYLLFLQEKGFPIPKSVSLLSEKEIRSFCGEQIRDGLEEVIKPLDGGESGRGVEKVESRPVQIFLDTFERYGSLLVQPYLKGVQNGEVSLVFLGDTFSHAVKKPLSGDIRVNYFPGKEYEHYVPTDEEVALGREIRAVWETPIDVMRLDLIHQEGKPQIIEVELINPAIYERLEGIGSLFAKNLYNY